MRSATDILRDEHQVILRVLLTLESAAEQLAAGGAMPEERWASMIAWLRAYADGNHHAKEEKVLFPAMIKAGVPDEGGPVAVMLQEHAEGRALLAMMYTGEPADKAAAARRYIRLLRDHIDKENGVLFPLADAVLDERDQAEVCRELASLETQRVETGLEFARD
jgi:hemerythrin-like domain-containing protein